MKTYWLASFITITLVILNNFLNHSQLTFFEIFIVYQVVYISLNVEDLLGRGKS